jgi:hypothetical protein
MYIARMAKHAQTSPFAVILVSSVLACRRDGTEHEEDAPCCWATGVSSRQGKFDTRRRKLAASTTELHLSCSCVSVQMSSGSP